MKADLNYSLTDAYRTFPKPSLSAQMSRSGDMLDTFRRSLMARREIGLTALYHKVTDEAVQDESVIRLRKIHMEVDEAVREAYALDEEREPGIREYEGRAASAPLPGWREIELGHGFHQTRQGCGSLFVRRHGWMCLTSCWR
jgi:hypothetical protein